MRILVIEDDEAIRSVLDRGLRAEGFDVDACADGASGLWKGLEGLEKDYQVEAASSPSGVNHVTFTRAA